MKSSFQENNPQATRPPLSRADAHPSTVKERAKIHAPDIVRKFSAAPEEEPWRPVRALKLDEVIKRTGKGRTSIYNLMNKSHSDYDPLFPRNFPVGKRARRWSDVAINDWVLSQIALGKVQDAERGSFSSQGDRNA